MIELPDFLARFGEMFAVGGIELTEDTRIGEDLGFDSLMVMETLLWLEDQAGCVMPSTNAPQLITLGDAHTYLQGLLQLHMN